MSMPMRLLKDASEAAREADKDAEDALTRRDALALKAYEADPATTYDDLAAIMGITRHRVGQVLAAQRSARATMTV